MSGLPILCRDFSLGYTSMLFYGYRNSEAAENFAKLKESVLATLGKRTDLDPKDVSAKILEVLSKAVKPQREINRCFRAQKPILERVRHEANYQELRELMENFSFKPPTYRSRFGDANWLQLQ